MLAILAQEFQCWNILNWTLQNRIQWNLNQNGYIFIQGNAFKNSSGKWWPSCLGLNVLITNQNAIAYRYLQVSIYMCLLWHFLVNHKWIMPWKSSLIEVVLHVYDIFLLWISCIETCSIGVNPSHSIIQILTTFQQYASLTYLSVLWGLMSECFMEYDCWGNYFW